MIDHFEEAFRRTMLHEGENEISDDPRDSGGQTYSGISRVYWPNWIGWPLVDEWLKTGAKPYGIEQLVREFYRQNFWDIVKGDAVAKIFPSVAYELFDTGVNLDPYDAVRLLQRAYNMARGEYGKDLLVDGRLGQKTLETLDLYRRSMPSTPAINEEILLNCMNGEQYIEYKNNPKRKYFRGWFRRV